MLRRLNDLPIFDPERLPGREAVARVVGCLAIAAFVIRRILQLPGWPGYLSGMTWLQRMPEKLSFLPKILIVAPFDLESYYGYYGYTRDQIGLLWTMQASVWLVETGILLAYVLALITRARAQSVAKGFMETAFPLILAGLPFVIVMTEYTFHRWFVKDPRDYLTALYGVNAVLFAAGALNVVGLLTLRRAFTIMTEARVLVRSGLYRRVRHPLYAVHFVIYFCYTVLHFHAATVALYVFFVAGQTLRARIEERKLAAAFPEYEEYRRTTGMFFPRIWGRESTNSQRLR